MENELKTWTGILADHEAELQQLNKPINVTEMSAWDIDKRIERKLHLEQLIKEDKEIIQDIKQEMRQ